jgi:hypothetical protein
MTFGDAHIPSGSTVAVSGGGLAVEKVTGNGSVIDLGGTNVTVPSGTTASANGCTFSGGSSTDGGAINAKNARSTINAYSCVISGCAAQNGGGIRAFNGTLNDCTIVGYSATIGGGIDVDNVVLIESSVVSGNIAGFGKDVYINSNGTATIKDSTIGTATLYGGSTTLTKANIVGSCVVDAVNSRSYGGSVIINSGATIDLTGNTNATPIAPGGGITVQQTASIVYGTAENPTTGTMVFDSGTNPRITQIASGGVVVTNAAFYPLIKGVNNSITNLGIQSEKGLTFDDSEAAGITLSNCSFYLSGFYAGVTNTTAQATIGGTMVNKSGAMNFIGVPGGTVTVLPNTVLDISSTTSGTYIVNAALLNIGSNVSIIQVGGTTVSVNGGSAGSFVPASGNVDVRLLPDGTTNGDEA